MEGNLYEDIMRKKAAVSVVGLGYVGIPIAIAFAEKGVRVIGFDLDRHKIGLYQAGTDPTQEVGDDAIRNTTIDFTCDEARLREARFHIVAVPTPVNQDHTPDLSPVICAGTMVGRNLCRGSVVVFESTVYPGVTEDVCIPILEKESGLSAGRDFKVGYSPERINPGDKEHTVEKIMKVTSGSTPGAAEKVDALYRSVIQAGTFPVSSIKVAEAAKVIENSQRDINIAFMNELSKIFHLIGIDTNEVLAAAGTKWNFLPFKPGLVGGHCIGVDPYYLIRKAEDYGFHPGLILYGRRINDTMGEYIAGRVVKCMIKKDVPVRNAEALVLGFTFKENCPDVRNSKVGDVVRYLGDYGINVTIYDPWARPDDVRREYGLNVLSALPDKKFDVVVLAVAHTDFLSLDIPELVKEHSVVYDVKGCLNPAWVDDRL